MKLNLKRPIIFFDLETTGVDILVDRIVQIAIIKIFPDGSRETKNYLINPEIPIPKEASDVHGITDDMVKDSPTFSKYAKAINQYCEDSDFGGYNSNQFDIPLLIEEFNRSGIDFDINNRAYIDVMRLEFILNPRNLGSIYKKYTGLELENAHDALSDIEATISILEKQIEVFDLPLEVSDLDTISQGDKIRVDLAGKLCNIDGKICWSFGKNINQPIQDDLGYVSWFLKQGVPTETRIIINKILKNNG